MKDWTGNRKSVFVCNGASNHSDGERQSEDYYATEPKAIHKLCAVEQFTDTVWECACGGGHMVLALQENGYKVYATDIVNRWGGVLSRTSSPQRIRRLTSSRTRHTGSQRNSWSTRSTSLTTAGRWLCSSNSPSWRVSPAGPCLRSTRPSGYGYSRSGCNAPKTATSRPTSKAVERRSPTGGSYGKRVTREKLR